MGTTAEAANARAAVIAFQRQQLSLLLGHVESAIRRHRAGQLDALGVDAVIARYSDASRELARFCSVPDDPDDAQQAVARIDRMQREGRVPDWWELAGQGR
jgi:hypothetical protein